MDLRSLLLPLTPLYAGAVKIRTVGYQRGWLRSVRLPLPVISIGNLTFGGTGKTPTVISLVRDLVRRGRSPAVLTRGYGRSESGPLVVIGPDPKVAVEVAGDEPLELAWRLPGVPIVVDADRARGGREAMRLGADTILLDDGFQHLRLQRDLNLVLIDAGDPWGGERLPPRGRLREPVSAMGRASAALVSKLPAGSESLLRVLTRQIHQVVPELPVIASSLQLRRLRTPEGLLERTAIDGRRVLAFAGIGRPAGFVQLLKDAGAEVVAQRWFRDHHPYQVREVAEIVTAAADHGAIPVTTAKDAVKLGDDAPVWVAEADMVPHGGSWEQLWQLLPELLHETSPLSHP
jgi:tetraacyldisaccharide 4'-kinase